MKNLVCLNPLKLYILIIGILVGLGSCNTSSSLSDSGLVQKRRYQKGYHLNLRSNSGSKSNKEEFSQIEKEAPLVASIDGEMNIEDRGAPKILKNRPVEIDNHSGEISEISHTKVVSPQIQSNESKRIKKYSKHKLHSSDPDYYAPATSRKVNTLALLSFIFAILSLFILGIPFGIAAVVCGIIGLSQIGKSPEVYKGKGFAIVGLIIGLIAVIIVLAALSAAA